MASFNPMGFNQGLYQPQMGRLQAPIDYNIKQPDAMASMRSGLQMGQAIAAIPDQMKKRQLDMQQQEQRMAMNDQAMQQQTQNMQQQQQQQQQSDIQSGESSLFNLAVGLKGKNPQDQAGFIMQQQKLYPPDSPQGKILAESLTEVNADPELFNKEVDTLVQRGYDTGALQAPEQAPAPKDTRTQSQKDFDFWSQIKDPQEKMAFGQQAGFIQKVNANTTKVDTPNGYMIIDDQTGEPINKVVIPEKQKIFDETQKQNKIEAERKAEAEKRKIKEYKIEEDNRIEQVAIGLEGTKNTLSNITDIISSDLGSVTGLDRKLPTFRSGTKDLLDTIDNVRNSLTVENLSKMSGVLSESDIKILASDALGLGIDDDGFTSSPERVKKQLRAIQKKLVSKLERAVKRGDMSEEDFNVIKLSSMSDEELEQATKGGK